jgi:glycosyltransferase involved in cell wall biosynthesis
MAAAHLARAGRREADRLDGRQQGLAGQDAGLSAARLRHEATTLKISVVIPTHNRADSLRNAVESILPLRGEADFEFVIVDNNSTDTTRQVVESYAPLARYVFEGNTSFTMARKAGADHSTGDILLYLDDDVLVRPGSLKKIVEVFTRHPDCGVIAGHIDPKYTEPPPQWALECQQAFNGWSLFNSETIPGLRADFQTVPSAAGPMMAIRRAAYDRAGGFPPDTIGVETNRAERSFNKLYIGPGDYGLCLKVRAAGFNVYYSSDIAVFHVIPPIRFTIQFWRSRVIGEGYCEAITQRGFFGLSGLAAYRARLRWRLRFLHDEEKLLARLARASAATSADRQAGVLPEELLVLYAKAYLDMDYVLRRHPKLWEFLWQIGSEGVSSANYDDVMARLPREYKELVSNAFVYEATPIDSREAYQRILGGRGYHRRNLGLLLRHQLSRGAVINVVETLRALKARLRPQAQPGVNAR